MRSGDCHPLVSVIHRLIVAWSHFSEPKRTLKTSRAPVRIRLRLLPASVVSTILYGCESWTLSEHVQRGVKGVASKLLPQITGKSTEKEARNPSVDVVMWARGRGWSWFGHILRIEESRTVRKVLNHIKSPRLYSRWYTSSRSQERTHIGPRWSWVENSSTFTTLLTSTQTKYYSWRYTSLRCFPKQSVSVSLWHNHILVDPSSPPPEHTYFDFVPFLHTFHMPWRDALVTLPSALFLLRVDGVRWAPTPLIKGGVISMWSCLRSRIEIPLKLLSISSSASLT